MEDQYRARYGPSAATQRLIIEQELRTCYNTLQLLEYRLRVERRIAQTLGDSSAQAIGEIEQDLRRFSIRIEEYSGLLAELGEVPLATNGAHG